MAPYMHFLKVFLVTMFISVSLSYGVLCFVILLIH